MKTLSAKEASADLGALILRAVSGECIAIQEGQSIVELHPRPSGLSHTPQKLSPLEALERIKNKPLLTEEQAIIFTNEVYAERKLH